MKAVRYTRRDNLPQDRQGSNTAGSALETVGIRDSTTHLVFSDANQTLVQYGTRHRQIRCSDVEAGTVLSPTEVNGRAAQRAYVWRPPLRFCTVPVAKEGGRRLGC